MPYVAKRLFPGSTKSKETTIPPARSESSDDDSNQRECDYGTAEQRKAALAELRRLQEKDKTLEEDVKRELLVDMEKAVNELQEFWRKDRLKAVQEIDQQTQRQKEANRVHYQGIIDGLKQQIEQARSERQTEMGLQEAQVNGTKHDDQLAAKMLEPMQNRNDWQRLLKGKRPTAAIKALQEKVASERKEYVTRVQKLQKKREEADREYDTSVSYLQRLQQQLLDHQSQQSQAEPEGEATETDEKEHIMQLKSELFDLRIRDQENKETIAKLESEKRRLLCLKSDNRKTPRGGKAKGCKDPVCPQTAPRMTSARTPLSDISQGKDGPIARPAAARPQRRKLFSDENITD